MVVLDLKSGDRLQLGLGVHVAENPFRRIQTAIMKVASIAYMGQAKLNENFVAVETTALG